MGRLAPIDWMRGFVMVLMAVDHGSMAWNGGRLSEDSAAMYDGAALDLGQHLLRWITHLCAPTFVFLAGTALALSVASRKARGLSDGEIDREILLRGAFIALLDILWMSALAPPDLLLQVLYAIGASMCCMALLRRLPTRWLFALGAGWFLVGEAVTGLFWTLGDPDPPFAVAALLAVHTDPAVRVIYPLVPWLAMMMMGWAFGSWLRTRRDDPPIRELALAGAAGLVLFALVRGLNGYGNMGLYRLDHSLAQWLHVSKYPPSLAFAALELGLMALGLATCFALAKRVAVHDRGPILVFGQTALFFYLLHMPLLMGTSIALAGQPQTAGPLEGLVAAGLVLVALYPLCLAYRALKRRRPTSLLRFV